MASALSSELDDTDKIKVLIDDASSLGLKIEPPNINKSFRDFISLNEETILFGLGSIKGVGENAIENIIEQRKKGWKRLILFSSFLKPGKLNIPPLKKIFKYAFKKDLRNWRSHFGIYPFLWDEDWESSLVEIMGKDTPKIQIAPVLQKLIFPRSKEVLVKWLENIKCFEDMEYLIPAHFTAPIKFTIEDCQKLINEINSQKWDKLPEDNKFLIGLYKKLFELGIIPEEVNL